MLPRALVEDVALRLPSDRVVAFPQVGDASFDYRIAVDVSRFDVDATGAATLAARWQLYARSAPRALLVADDTLQRQIEGRGYDAYAASLSGVLADLGDRIAGGEFGSRFRRPIARHPLISGHGDAGRPKARHRCGRAPGERLWRCAAVVRAYRWSLAPGMEVTSAQVALAGSAGSRSVASDTIVDVAGNAACLREVTRA